MTETRRPTANGHSAGEILLSSAVADDCLVVTCRSDNKTHYYVHTGAPGGVENDPKNG